MLRPAKMPPMAGAVGSVVWRTAAPPVLRESILEEDWNTSEMSYDKIVQVLTGLSRSHLDF